MDNRYQEEILDFQDEVLKTIEIIADRKVEKAGYDKTIVGIVYEMDKSLNEFTIQFQNGLFKAYADESVTRTISLKDKVFVLVPQGVFSNRKIVIGRAEKDSVSVVPVIGLEQRYIPVTQDIFQLYRPNIHETKYGAYAYPAEDEMQIGSYTSGTIIFDDRTMGQSEDSFTYQVRYNEYIHKVLEIKASNLTLAEKELAINKETELFNKSTQSVSYSDEHNIFQKISKDQKLLLIKGKFSTLFEGKESLIKGQYGIEVKFYYKDTEEQTKILPIRLGLENMNGNPYRFNKPTWQAIVPIVDGDSLLGIQSIRLFAYGFAHNADKVYLDNQEVFVEELQAYYVKESESADGYQSFISYLDGSTFGDYGNLRLQMNFRENGVLKNSKGSSNQFEYKWFVSDPTVHKNTTEYNEYAGYGWRAIPNSNKRVLTVSKSDDFGRAEQRSYKCVLWYKKNIYQSATATLFLNSNKSKYEIITAPAGQEHVTFTLKKNSEEPLVENYRWRVELSNGETISNLDSFYNTTLKIPKKYADPYCYVYCDIYFNSNVEIESSSAFAIKINSEVISEVTNEYREICIDKDIIKGIDIGEVSKKILFFQEEMNRVANSLKNMQNSIYEDALLEEWQKEEQIAHAGATHRAEYAKFKDRHECYNTLRANANQFNPESTSKEKQKEFFYTTLGEIVRKEKWSEHFNQSLYITTAKNISQATLIPETEDVDIIFYLNETPNSAFRFEYDEDGTIMSQQEAHNLNFKLNWKNKNGGAYNIKYKWIFPTESTSMIKSAGVNENGKYLDMFYENREVEPTSQTSHAFSLAKKFNHNRLNNMVELHIFFPDMQEERVYTLYIDCFKMGMIGTNGTTYSLNARLDNSHEFLEIQAMSATMDTFKIKTLPSIISSIDIDGVPLENISEYYDLKLSIPEENIQANPFAAMQRHTEDWYSRTIAGSQVTFNPTATAANGTTIVGDGSSSFYFAVLKIEAVAKESLDNAIIDSSPYKLFEHKDLVTYISIPVFYYEDWTLDINTIGVTQANINGTTMIQYLNSGNNPQFSNQPYTIQGRVKEKPFIIQTKNLVADEEYYGYYGDTISLSSQTRLKVPANFYTGYNYGGIIFKAEDNQETLLSESQATQLIIPIFAYLNKYEFNFLRGWSGGKMLINEELGYLVAPQIAAGVKHDDNTFSGLLGGLFHKEEKNQITGKVEVLPKTGLVGLKEGVQMYGFYDNGTAFIGSAGAGRIDFDGLNSKILGGHVRNSKGLEGYMTELDLNQGRIIIRDNELRERVILGSYEYYKVNDATKPIKGYGIQIKDPNPDVSKNKVSIFDERGVLQTWQDSTKTNIDRNTDLTLELIAAPQLKEWVTARITCTVTPFQYYTQPESTEVQGSAIINMDTSGLREPSRSLLDGDARDTDPLQIGSRPWNWGVSDGGRINQTLDNENWSSDAWGGHNHGIKPNTNLMNTSGGYGGTFEQSGRHNHPLYVDPHAHGMGVNDLGHPHFVSGMIPAHSHDIGLNLYAHTHKLIYGVFVENDVNFRYSKVGIKLGTEYLGSFGQGTNSKILTPEQFTKMLPVLFPGTVSDQNAFSQRTLRAYMETGERAHVQVTVFLQAYARAQ